MLTRKQFLQKHTKKYGGLSKSEKDQRYADYLATSPGVKVRKTPQMDANMRITRQIEPNHKFGWKSLISPCTAMYTKVLTNPFGNFDELPCIPDVITLPSWKFKTTTRGSFVIGTSGVGYVGFKPGCPVSDSPSVEFTTITFAGFNYQAFPFLGTQVGNNDSVLITTDFATGQLETRLVGAGIRCHYQSSEFQRSGMVVLHRQPGNVALTSGQNSTNLLQNRTSTQAPAVRTAESVSYRPDTPGMLGYVNPILPQGTTLLIYVEGGTPGTIWNFEAVQFFEVIGNRQNPTMSHSDPVGLGAALGALPVQNSLLPPMMQEVLAIKKLAENVAKSTSTVTFAQSLGKTLKAGLHVARDIVTSDYGGLLVDVPSYFGNLTNTSYIGTNAMLGAPNRGPLIEDID